MTTHTHTDTDTADTVGRSGTVRRSVVVDVPIDRAFTFFTRDIGAWWDPDKHLLAEPLAEMIFEPQVGGHIIDRGVNGTENRWSRVLIYEPPTHVAFSWDINLAWQIETDPDKTSEVHVTFSANGEGRTFVELEHRHLDRHGDGWEAMRDAVGSPGGWNLEPYATAIGADATATITDDYMHEMLTKSRQYSIVLMRKTAKLNEAGAEAVIWEHGRRNFALRAEGKLAIVCPTRDDGEWAGIGIFDATGEEVEAIMEQDPAVAAGMLTYDVIDTRSFPGDALPG